MALGQNIPLFFRLYHKIKHDIILGVIQKGAKLSTIEELAKQHGVSQTSIRKSLDLLETEGLLTRKQGWGTVVPENVDLRLFDLGVIITSKNVLPEVETALMDNISAEWVAASPRLVQLLNFKESLAEQPIYKIHLRVIFRKKLEFKALLTYYFPEEWLGKVSLDKNTPPRDKILHLAKWMESTPLQISESLLPYLCTGEDADLLGLPDGTPVFYQTVVLTDDTGESKPLSVCWDMVSSANIFVRELAIKASPNS